MMSPAALALDPLLWSERAFQAHLLAVAGLCGWLAYHTFDSRRSNPGFPDLVLVRGGEMLYAELKTQKGRVRPEQQVWMDALRGAGQEVYLWRPSDLRAATQRLQRRRVPAVQAVAS